MESSILPLMLCVTVVFIVLMLSVAIRILPEYQRAVLFRLGRIVGVFGPGLCLFIPFIDRAILVDLREQTGILQAQSAITADNVRLTVDLTWRYRPTDPAKLVLGVANLHTSLKELAQQVWVTTIENQPYSYVLSNRPQLRDAILQQLKDASANWGVEVSSVQLDEIKKG